MRRKLRPVQVVVPRIVRNPSGTAPSGRTRKRRQGLDIITLHIKVRIEATWTKLARSRPRKVPARRARETRLVRLDYGHFLRANAVSLGRHDKVAELPANGTCASHLVLNRRSPTLNAICKEWQQRKAKACLRVKRGEVGARREGVSPYRCKRHGHTLSRARSACPNGGRTQSRCCKAPHPLVVGCLATQRSLPSSAARG